MSERDKTTPTFLDPFGYFICGTFTPYARGAIFTAWYQVTFRLLPLSLCES